MARYFSSRGYSNQSAEKVSKGDSHAEILGDNFASTHLQGELLVTMFDLEAPTRAAWLLRVGDHNHDESLPQLGEDVPDGLLIPNGRGNGLVTLDELII